MKIFKEFEGKTAFVTGAASGMGQAAAICFGGLGCRVAVAARNPKALETVQTIRENGGEAIFVECDVTDDDSVRKAIETTVKTFGSLDYAFNNARLWGGRQKYSFCATDGGGGKRLAESDQYQSDRCFSLYEI